MPSRDHDRALLAPQQRFLGGRQLDQVSCSLEAGRHQRERLVLAVLARTQRGDGRPVVSAAGEMKAAHALDGEDPSNADLCRGGLDRISTLFQRNVIAPRVDQPNARAARRAGIRLGVKAAVERILVLRSALGAHLE